MSTTDINADAAAAFKKKLFDKVRLDKLYRRDISLITERQTVYTGRFQNFRHGKIPLGHYANVREWVFDIAWVWADIRRDRLGGIANVSFMS